MNFGIKFMFTAGGKQIMYNYEHEIECPKNKGIINYLWFDYFHDSTIHQINFEHGKGLVMLTLECCRDKEALWERFKDDCKIHNLYVNEHSDKFTYILTFKGTQYFHQERLIVTNEYINGRFKDTALLSKLQAETKKKLYHYRIQTDDGFIDIIFSDFHIRKKAGRVKYSIDEVLDQTSPQKKNISFTNNDFDCFLALQQLYRSNDSSILEASRKYLRLAEDFKDSCLYSAYLLGKFGTLSDTQYLFNLYIYIDDIQLSKSVLLRRNILDAIELIQYRNQ